MRTPWIQKRRQWLIEYARTHEEPMTVITQVYNERFSENRSEDSIAYQLWGLRRGPNYSDEQNEWLRRYINEKPRVVADMFNKRFCENRSVQSISNKLCCMRKEIRAKYGDVVADATDRGNYKGF